MNYVDLTPVNNAVLDQGSSPECLAYAEVAAMQVMAGRDGILLSLSPDYLYVQTQTFEHYTGQGIEFIQDASAVLASQGDCTPTVYQGYNWTLDASNALNYKVTGFIAPDNAAPASVQLDSIKALLNAGEPVVFGCFLTMDFMRQFNSGDAWNVQQSFNTVPSLTNPVFGSHGMTILGYDDSTQMFKVQNSWGTSNGEGGYVGISYQNMMAIITQYGANTGLVIDGQTMAPIQTAVHTTQFDIFNALMNAAEPLYGLQPAPTAAFDHYYYRVYDIAGTPTAIGVDAFTLHIENYANGVFTDLGTEQSWIAKIGINPNV
jgi:hypothetical protein